MYYVKMLDGDSGEKFEYNKSSLGKLSVPF